MPTEGTLLEHALELLRNADVTHAEIARHTELHPSWLTRFANGEIPDPSVNRVQRLFDYLSQRSRA